MKAKRLLTSIGQSVGQQRQVGDDGEDPAEDADDRRAAFVQITLSALLRNENRGDHRKPEPEQAEGMPDPADYDQQRHAEEDVRPLEGRRTLNVEDDGVRLVHPAAPARRRPSWTGAMMLS